jgi:uncharacterized protein (TIRG00374 family)
VRREAKVTRLLVPTVIGFTGLAVLGRPGELIRPYLIARNEDLAFSSQLAVWTVERIFDLSGFALLFIAAIFFSAAPQHLPYYARFRQASFLLAALIVVFALAAAVIGVKGASLALWFEGQCSRLSSDLGPKIALRIREFRAGLNIIDGASSLIQLIAVSTLMWFTIALSFQQVANSYGAQVLRLPISNVIVLMGSTVVGSVIQLPAVGGGSQLATIAALQLVFHVPHELAASCGILIWLVTFVSVIPSGLLLARKQQLSLSKLSQLTQVSPAASDLDNSPDLSLS